MNEYLSKSTEETKQIAYDFVSKLNPLDGAHQGARIIGLYGELGSGKTTFMKYLAESFGVKETVQSPTFVIEKIYNLPHLSSQLKALSFSYLIHIDAYRIENEKEMLNLGWQEIISNPKNLICIEWPEKIIGIMPEHIKINFQHFSENERKITINNL